MVQMVREGAETGSLPNSSDFMNEFEVSRRTVARDLDFLRDEERAPLAYDDARHGFRLTDETYMLPPVRISRKEAFSFGLARKLLAHYEGTPLHLDMRSVLDKIAESLEGDITIDPKLAVYITERQWHPSQEFRTRQYGSVEMRMETTGRKELVRWVLSWMPDVKVLAPKSLRDRIAEKLRDGLRAQQ